MISFHTARSIDRKLGRPLCMVLSKIRRARPRPIPRYDTIKEIVIIKMWGLGSIILSSPVIRNLKLHYPHARIRLITLSQNKFLYSRSPFLDDVLCIDMSTWTEFVRSTVDLLRVLRRTHVDVMFDLEFASRFTALIAFFSGARFTLGFYVSGSGKQCYDAMIPYDETAHVTDIFLRALDVVKIPRVDCRPIGIEIDESDQSVVDRFLKIHQIGRFIVFNPNASELCLERLWPIQNYGTLADTMSQMFPDLRIIIMGDHKDKPRVRRVLDVMRHRSRVVDASGIFSISQLACLLRKAELMISNDSGPMHLSAVMGTPTIGLFGPETPSLYGPLGPYSIAMASGAACSPCLSIYNDKIVSCNHGAVCMRELSVQSVLEAAVRLIFLKKWHLSKSVYA